MADTLQFDLVSPERKLASLQATEVLIPGAEGDMTVMAAHVPLIATLRPGLLRVESAEGSSEYVVLGGFAEITASSASVLAERAVPRSEVTREFIDEVRREWEEAHAAAEEGDKDAASKALADLSHLMDQMV